MRDSVEYWGMPEVERREYLIVSAGRRVADGSPLEDVPDFLLIDRLMLELASAVQQIKDLEQANQEGR